MKKKDNIKDVYGASSGNEMKHDLNPDIKENVNKEETK